MVVLRSYEPADLDEVSRLRASVYQGAGDDHHEWHASIWRWLETHPLAAELHRWVLVDDDRVVGFLAAMPQYYRIAGRRVVAHTPGDYMVDPAYGFHAVTLMRALFRTVTNCVSCDWLPSVTRLQRWFGMVDVAELQHAAKVLTVARLPVALPRPVGGVVNLGLAAVDRVLTASPPRLPVKVLDGFDERFDRFFEALAAHFPCLPEKDAAFLRWRYGPGSPQRAEPVLAVLEGDELLGYAVLRVTATDRAGYLLDLTVRPGRYDVARALLGQAIHHFRAAGANIIRYRFLASPVSPRPRDLWRLGFFPRKQRHRLQVKFADPELHAVATNPANWAYSAGDGELSFWVQ